MRIKAGRFSSNTTSILMLLLACALLLVMRVTYLLMDDPERFPINTVKISASFQNISRNELEDILRPYLNYSFFMLPVEALENKLRSLNWIQKVCVKRYWPDILNISLEEKNPRNFITKIITYNKICSVSNSMTVLPELLPIMLDMLQNNITVTINLTNPGLISHNVILEMYKEIVDPNFKWDNSTIDEQAKILDSGRSNNYLDTTRLSTLYPEVLGIKDSVRNMLLMMKDNQKLN
jgi:hypothetical protein